MNWPESNAQNAYALVVALFFPALGLCYLAAFVSIALQIEALAGENGILPLAVKLQELRTSVGWTAYLRMPTLFWFDASDRALALLAWGGAGASAMVVIGRWRRAALLFAFVAYLSLYHAGDLFMNFQWDGLLLEAGFLALFLSPTSALSIFLFRWLLFRLRFMSGLSKLVSQDPTWSGLTALNHYFEVQPLPNPLSWYAHQLPQWLLKVGTVATLGVEILVPLMMFLPRPLRLAAAWITILWQVLIILTSNHNWFNFLTIALCLFLLDDQALRSLLPARWRGGPAPPVVADRRRRELLLAPVAAVLVTLGLVQIWELVSSNKAPGIAGRAIDYAESFRIVSKYHVFPTMKTERIELEILGSRDGTDWRPYPFRFKPQDLQRMPGIVVPHHPRLDWMMWFVTLHPAFVPWFERFLQGLLAQSPPVLALLASDPFAGEPPRYLRVDAYRYRFTTPEERARSGHWWHREPLGPFMPMPWLERPPAAAANPGRGAD